MANDNLPGAAAGIACGCTAIPWIVVFYMFAFDGGMDPEHCWVREGELWVSRTETGLGDERDVGAYWRTLYTWAFIVYVALGVLPTLSGILLCIGDAVVAVGAVFAGCSMVAFLVKSAIFWWAVVLRSMEEGRVAAGKMIAECEEANPNLGAIIAGTDADDSSIDTVDGIGRLLQDEAGAVVSAASCNDQGAF